MLQVLHLIGIGLHEQKRAIEEGNRHYDFLSRACKPSVDAKSKKGKIIVPTYILTLTTFIVDIKGGRN